MFEYDTVNRWVFRRLRKGVQWWRWCDLRWQTVPDLGTSNRKLGSVANGGPVGLWLDEAASVGGAESSSTRGKSATQEPYINSPFAHGCLFWPGCQICTVSVGSIWCTLQQHCSQKCLLSNCETVVNILQSGNFFIIIFLNLPSVKLLQKPTAVPVCRGR